MTVPALKVLVVVDRPDRGRREFWSEVVQSLNDKGVVPVELHVQALADVLDQPLVENEPVFIERLQRDTDVLIINWDALNNDPDFGADVALRWFEVRRGPVRQWVSAGGILLLEGQAVGGVPLQAAYDAVLGKGEVSLCGAEDRANPVLQMKRAMGDCKVTRVARSAPGFATLDCIKPEVHRTQEDMFPKDTAGRLVGWTLTRDNWDWARSMYRGWFRRSFWPGRCTLNWVTYIRRDKRWLTAYPTMLVAKCGKGAFFVSTMLLASTGQSRLITAILQSHGQVERLPEPHQLPVAISGQLLATTASVLSILLTLLVGLRQDEARASFATAVVGFLIAVALYLAPAVYRLLGRLARAIVGT